MTERQLPPTVPLDRRPPKAADVGVPLDGMHVDDEQPKPRRVGRRTPPVIVDTAPLPSLAKRKRKRKP